VASRVTGVQQKQRHELDSRNKTGVTLREGPKAWSAVGFSTGRHQARLGRKADGLSIAITRSVGGFFDEVVGEAVKAQQVDATDEARSYLVALLSEFARPAAGMGDTFERPLAFLLDEALRTNGAGRFQKLRILGDGVLYITGFFGDHIENRGVDMGYVTSVGATAYRGAATMLRRPNVESNAGNRTDENENVFGELSVKFDRFVDVLSTVADSTFAQQARGERGILKLYERWLRSGSSTLARELGARGLVPVRGTGGLH
jgi:hypothetical protein